MWEFVTSGIDGIVDARLFGVSIFKKRWRATGETADVVDPNCGTVHRFRVYTVEADGRPMEFAAGEFSNTVWGFYVRRSSGGPFGGEERRD